MNYQEAIEAVRQDPLTSYIGLCIRPHGKNYHLDIYDIRITELDEPEWISIGYEGGIIFEHDYGGEQDCYSLEDVPVEAKLMLYQNTDGIPQIFGDLPEYALFKIFPDLPDPEDLWEKYEKEDFITLAQEFVSIWGSGKEKKC